MYDLILQKLRVCLAEEDREAALQLVRAASAAGVIQPRDAVELMLAVRNGTLDLMIAAVDALRSGVPGSYRYIPTADYAAA